MTNPGASSSPTDFEGFSLLIALQTSAQRQGIKILKTGKEGQCPQGNGYYKQIKNA
jgi:hypothetical protein